MGSYKKRINSNSLCVPAELNTRTTPLPASSRRKRELPPGSLGETPTCDMKIGAAAGRDFTAEFNAGDQTQERLTGVPRDVEDQSFPAFRRNTREISFTGAHAKDNLVF